MRHGFITERPAGQELANKTGYQDEEGGSGSVTGEWVETVTQGGHRAGGGLWEGCGELSVSNLMAVLEVQTTGYGNSTELMAGAGHHPPSGFAVWSGRAPGPCGLS